MSRKPRISEICRRIGQLRLELYGQRGKARFAKQLGLSPSTYSYYETDRVPSAEVLVNIADVAGVDLRWLLTGEAAEPAVPADHPALRRIAALLADHPDAAGPLTAFVDLLSESLTWPKKQPAAEPAPPAQPPADGPAAAQGQRDWIPILGRSAAGVPQFWADAADGRGLTALADLVRKYARRSGRRVQQALVRDEGGPGGQAVQIVTLSAPDPDNVAEFLAAAELRAKYPDAFAVRVDGDSMAPEIRHGDVVVCSPSVPAANGRAAVVQLQNQIGVTCKIYRAAGDTVHLVPVNEQYPPQSFPADDVVWALRVLGRVAAS